MKRSGSLLVCCALLLSGGLSAQTVAAADPVTGTWTGTIGPTAGSRTAVTFALKYDRKSVVSGAVTGPQIRPGAIKTGTYDAKSGALKFTVVVEGDGTQVDFNGTLANGNAEGRISGGIGDGTFKFSKAEANGVASKPATRATTTLPDNAALAAARRSFTEVSEWLSRAADAVPADKYAYKPAPTVRSLGQVVAHVADAYQFYCNRAAGRNVQWTTTVEKGATTKAAIVQKLKEAMDVCNASYSAANGEIGPLIENVGHTSLHYGNIVTYMRMLGLVPPSS